MKKTLILFLHLLTGIVAMAQVDKSKMESERSSLQRELNEIQKVYNQVKGQKKETIGQLTLLQRKMEVQDKYIGNISKEIRLINDDIYLSALEINKLQKELDTLKTQYARSVVYAYKNKSTYDYLNFIFSASNFNDALKRVGYLKSYRSYRQEQVANIIATQKQIEDRKQQLLGKKTQKSSALQNQTQQLHELENQKKEKDAVMAKLKSKEDELKREIAVKKKRDAELKNAIAAVIRREIEAARKKAEAEEAERSRRKREADALAKKNAAANPDRTATASTPAPVEKKAAPKKDQSFLNLNESDVALSSGFQNNRGRLPWPVDNGYVSIPFGNSKVEGTQLVQDNPGITISTPSAGAAVKAVFDGEISAISSMGDGSLAVMVRHGKFFTVYSNLSSASVSKGSNVKVGQVIGRAGQGDDGTGGQVDFMLMNESKNVNPTGWLRPR
ncbi:MAG TPA: peptidoglycan DD-metalloendopeptidase family protein [Flavisolibacter sp.]|jgi:septal ring factor EnvC (AmiA/AmiB activator)|nr:peptidoglycan DD-metalloendopeptidase family protein [Flavisolibacter sp.]